MITLINLGETRGSNCLWLAMSLFGRFWKLRVALEVMSTLYVAIIDVEAVKVGSARNGCSIVSCRESHRMYKEV